MVDLPLPLSPASATISRWPIWKFTSSTACRVRLDSAPPILKCLLRCSARSSGVVTGHAPFLGVAQAAHQRPFLVRQLGGDAGARVEGHRAPVVEPAAGWDDRQVGRAAGDALERYPGAAD